MAWQAGGAASQTVCCHAQQVRPASQKPLQQVACPTLPPSSSPTPGPPTARCCRLREQNPAIQRLLDQPALAANELAMRLFFFYSAPDRPLLEPSELAAAAGGTAAAAGGTAAAAGGTAAAEDGAGGGEGEGATQAAAAGCGVEAVPAELLEQLALYRGIACLTYDFNTGWLGVASTYNLQHQLTR